MGKEATNGYSWELVRKRVGGSPFGNKCRASITPGGSIALSDAATRKLGKPEAVLIYFDERRNALGFEASTLEQPNSYRVRYAKSTSTGSFQAKSLLRHINLDLAEKRYYTPSVAADGKLQIMLAAGETTP